MVFKTSDNKLAEQIKSGTVLPIMESFYTIQGEGFYKGTASYFIRLGGCDVGCHWCDVKESWDANIHSPTKTEKLVQEAKRHANLAIITGGEPTMYNLNPLTTQLNKAGIRTHIETSGAYPLTGNWNWVCLSPKKRKLPTSQALREADELKVVIYNKHDFIFAEEQAHHVNKNCILYLQPEWSKREKMMPEIVEYVLTHPKWKVSLQSHKYLNVR